MKLRRTSVFLLITLNTVLKQKKKLSYATNQTKQINLNV